MMNWRNLLKATWLLACIAVLLWDLISCTQRMNPTLMSECSLLAGGMMVILSFPIGLLWLWLVSGAAYLAGQLGIDISAVLPISNLVVWIGFVVVGYLQWFILLPWAIRLIGKRFNRVDTNNLY
jgi:hypothetical protein